MKLTTIICCTFLILFGLLATVYALTGFDTLWFLCAGNSVIYRSILSLSGIGALWLIFWLIVFRPTRFLS